MIPGIMALLVLAAFICVILSAVNNQKYPVLWVAVLLNTITLALMVFPK